MWRNVKVSWPEIFLKRYCNGHSVQIDGKVRATQIGTVSRGNGCAYFNAPGIFGSVKKARSWIKETIEKEMGGKGYCPKKS